MLFSTFCRFVLPNQIESSAKESKELIGEETIKTVERLIDDAKFKALEDFKVFIPKIIDSAIEYQEDVINSIEGALLAFESF